MSSCIFSTYSQGENRVTSTILAVLRRLPIDYSERLIGALLGQTEFQMIKFQNQPSKGSDGVPDAKISSRFQILIETKIKRNAINDTEQILRHLKRLDKNSSSQFLIVLTPDQDPPEVIVNLVNGDELTAKQLIWKSFADLDQAVNELLNDNKEVVPERDTFLLKQLQIMMAEEDLLESNKDVLVVAAKSAWPEYKQIHAYVCQPERSFQAVKYLAFYCDGEIKPIIAKILKTKDKVRVEPDANIEEPYKSVINKLIREDLREQGDFNKILILSSPDSEDTIKLQHAIINDLKSDTGRSIAFTQGQRYISSKSLEKARTTKDLLKLLQ